MTLKIDNKAIICLYPVAVRIVRNKGVMIALRGIGNKTVCGKGRFDKMLIIKW